MAEFIKIGRIIPDLQSPIYYPFVSRCFNKAAIKVLIRVEEPGHAKRHSQRNSQQYDRLILLLTLFTCTCHDSITLKIMMEMEETVSLIPTELTCFKHISLTHSKPRVVHDSNIWKYYENTCNNTDFWKDITPILHPIRAEHNVSILTCYYCSEKLRRGEARGNIVMLLLGINSTANPGRIHTSLI